MRVLIIGGTGFLSSAVTQVCLEEGHEVTLFTRGQRPVPDGVDAIGGDRSDHEAFPGHFADREFDGVIDCICYQEADARADLAAFAGRVGHLVMISTDFVYGAERRLPMTEDTRTDSLGDYGRNKVHAEQVLVDAWQEGDFPTSVLRPPHIMGAGGQLGSGSLAGRDPALLSRIDQGAPVFLLDGGALLIQPVLHRDIARAALAVMNKPQCFGQIYNCAGPEAVTTLQYYQTIAQVLNRELRVLHLPVPVYLEAFPDRAPFAHHRMFDVSKLARDSGYAPEATASHCIFEMVDWLQANGGGESYERSATETRLEEALQSGTAAAVAALQPGAP